MKIVKKILFSDNRGQSLVTLIIFMVTSIIIVSGAVAVIIINSKTTSKFHQGNIAYDIAEAGIENALIRLLRDPTYSGETLSIGGSSAVINVIDNGNDLYTITSEGTSGNFLRTIRTDVSYNNNIMTITSWSES